MTTDTKLKIIEAGASIIHTKGFNHTGIQEILQAAEVPKGSFYFYFKNKEDFGLQVIDYFIDHFETKVATILTETSMSPIMRLETLFNNFENFFSSQRCTLGCPVGNLSQEMGDLNETFREKLNEAIDCMAQKYIGVLSEAQLNGEISKELNVEETAYFMISSWHGALLRMKVTKNMEPLLLWRKFIMNHILVPADQ